MKIRFFDRVQNKQVEINAADVVAIEIPEQKEYDLPALVVNVKRDAVIVDRQNWYCDAAACPRHQNRVPDEFCGLCGNHNKKDDTDRVAMYEYTDLLRSTPTE